MTEYQYDDNTFILAKFIPVDDSFDHEFGTKTIKDYELDEFMVCCYVGGFEENVTPALTEERILYFKEWVWEQFVSERAAG